MKILVQKYGGTSVGSVARIQAIAERSVAFQQKGYAVVVVVSAMGTTTDDLLQLVKQVTAQPRQRELGMLLSTGEIISTALLALAIQSLGAKSTALTGAQGGISTDESYANARITDIDTTRIKRLLRQGEIVVVAGFQGRMADEITVLGRGGSDASAVALASALGARFCDIFTDVDGIYTADPGLVRNASLLQGISYEEMLELAASGAQVMMGRAVEIARKSNLRIRVRSSFNPTPGTIITTEQELENVTITGIAANTPVTLIEIQGIQINSHDTADILGQFTSQRINIILLCSNKAGVDRTNLSLVVHPEDVAKIEAILTDFRAANRCEGYLIRSHLAQVSIVGSGIATHYGVAYEMFETLANSNIEVLMTSTSEIKITGIVPADRIDEAVLQLHQKFELHTLKRNVLGNGNGKN
ncbi:MAG: aspartate kinase [Candidatus Zhuqueibacterota bacterium]